MSLMGFNRKENKMIETIEEKIQCDIFWEQCIEQELEEGEDDEE